MLNTDVIEVFDQVEVGTPVVIRCGGLLLGMLWFCDGFSGCGWFALESVHISVVHY